MAQVLVTLLAHVVRPISDSPLLRLLYKLFSILRELVPEFGILPLKKSIGGFQLTNGLFVRLPLPCLVFVVLLLVHMLQGLSLHYQILAKVIDALNESVAL